LQAGGKGACDAFASGLPQAGRLHALIAIQFGDAAAVEARLLTTDDPEAARAIMNLELTRHYVRTGTDLTKAAAALQAAALLDPSGELMAERTLLQACLALLADELATAHKLLRTLLEGTFTLDEKTRDEMLRLADRLISRAADHDKDATDQARRLFAEMNRVSPDEAVAAAAELADRYPETNALWIGLGLARLKSGDEPGAVLAFERARTVCPYDPEADYQLARLHERRARFSRAVFYLERGLEAAPAWTKGMWMIADMAMRAREPERASKALATLKRIYPSDVTVDLGRARAFLDRDDGVRAMAILKEATRAHPADLRPPVALARTAIALHGRAQSPEARARMVAEAETALELARAVSKDHSDVMAITSAVEKLRAL
jgi:tetratricopeptide (TPR) repeat protein